MRAILLAAVTLLAGCTALDAGNAMEGEPAPPKDGDVATTDETPRPASDGPSHEITHVVQTRAWNATDDGTWVSLEPTEASFALLASVGDVVALHLDDGTVLRGTLVSYQVEARPDVHISIIVAA